MTGKTKVGIARRLQQEGGRIARRRPVRVAAAKSIASEIARRITNRANYHGWRANYRGEILKRMIGMRARNLSGAWGALQFWVSSPPPKARLREAQNPPFFFWDPMVTRTC